jgi:hypothetical protein
MEFMIIKAIIFNIMPKIDQFTAKFKIWQHLKILHEATTEWVSLNGSYLLNISSPKLSYLQHVKRVAHLTGKFRLLVLVTAARWVQTVCSGVWNIQLQYTLEFVSLKYCLSGETPSTHTCSQLCCLDTYFATHTNRLEQKPKDRQSACTFTLSRMYHKHTVLHLCSNFLPGYSKKHIY